MDRVVRLMERTPGVDDVADSAERQRQAAMQEEARSLRRELSAVGGSGSGTSLGSDSLMGSVVTEDSIAEKVCATLETPCHQSHGRSAPVCACHHQDVSQSDLSVPQRIHVCGPCA